MKKNIHPKYQEVLFVDSSTGHKFVCRSAMQPSQTAKHEGKDYPVCPLSVSSYSHPFFTGSKGLVDAEGRVDKFKKRYTNLQQGKQGNKDASSKQDPSKDSKGKKKGKSA